MAEEVKLLGLEGSPFSCRVEIALKMKGIPYEMIPQDLANKSALLVQSNPYERVVARFWARFIDEKCLKAVATACLGKGKEQEKTMEEVFGVLKTLESQLEGKKFFRGDDIGFLDIVASIALLWFGVILE